MQVETIFLRSILMPVLSGLSFCILLGAYSLLRVLRCSVNWATWLLGGLILALCIIASLTRVFPGVIPHWLNIGNSLAGTLSFFIAVYAAGQWVARQWYKHTKQRLGKRLVQLSRNVLLFLRKHHQFFGCIVTAGAVAHTVLFLPLLSRISLYEEITGFVAIGILALSVTLGTILWFMSAVCKRPVSRAIYTVHSTLTITFFLALFLHI